MAEHEAPFSAERIEAELAEREQWLAEHPQPEHAPADLRLIADLRGLYPPAPDVAERLERVWQRVEQRRQNAAPRPRSSVPLDLHAARTERRRAMNILGFRREGRFTRVSSLVAAVALLVVVSGLIVGLVLVRPHGPNVASGNFAGGLETVLQATCNLNGSQCTPSDLAQLSKDRATLEQRIREGLNVSSSQVRLQGDDQLVIDLPPFHNDQALIGLLVQTGNAQFLDTGGVGLTVGQPVPAGSNYPVILTSADLAGTSVEAQTDPQTGLPVLLFQFKGSAQRTIANYTGAHLGNYLTITLDDTVVASAVIQSEITSAAQVIDGKMTLDSAKVLAAIFGSGPLPVPVTIVSQQRIGTTQTPLPTGWASSVATLTPTPTAALVQGGGLTSIHMVNATTGWAEGPVVKGWRVLRTSDGGTHWQDVTPPGVSALAGELPAYFLNASVAWVAAPEGDGGTLLFFRTTDGGQTWQQKGSLQSVSPAYLSFVNAQDGWALADLNGATGNETATLYRTTDGGGTWVQVSSTGIPPEKGTIPFAGTKRGLTFLNASTGWLTGFSNVGLLLYVTHDAGVTWQQQTLPLPSGVTEEQLEIIPPTFFNARDGILPVQVYIPTGGSENLVVYVTHDGGATWHSTAQVHASDRIVAFADATHGWASDGSKLFATTDGGQQWSQLPASSHLHDIASLNFVSSTTGWVISMPANAALELLKTTDGGQTWSVITPSL
jgi:photosystem II stability/assembly factor-like uncharacterized protein